MELVVPSIMQGGCNIPYVIYMAYILSPKCTPRGCLSLRARLPSLMTDASLAQPSIIIDDAISNAFNLCKPVANRPAEDHVALIQAVMDRSGMFFFGE